MNEQEKAWDGIIRSPLGGRSQKPRESGLTMVIDKGLGLSRTQDLLELGCDYIDLLKLAFGSSNLYSSELLQRKIELCREAGVEAYPGGTYMEIAILQGKVNAYLDRAWRLGFRTVEVSDGTIHLTPEHRQEVICRALDRGFRVISEVGKKDGAQTPTPEALMEQVLRDLDTGSYRVIVEGRESGKGVGLYDKNGDLKMNDLEDLVAGLPDPSLLIWEAPQKHQQEALIFRFGVNVNLGNIPTDEVIALECLRRGLRGDTLKMVLAHHPKLAATGEA